MVQDFKQVFRFLIVGILAVGVDFVVYFGLLRWLPGVPIPISKAISYLSGMTVSFTGHRNFVFKATDHKPQHQILPFFLLYTTSLIANNLMNSFILNLIGIKIIAWFLAICTSTSMNFIGLKFAVFKKTSFDKTIV